MRMSIAAIWSALWREARLTVVPAISTGFSSATGVMAPVRPTWYVTALSVVACCSDSNLYAMAHRGLLAVMPSSDCWLYALTLMTIPSMANGSA